MGILNGTRINFWGGIQTNVCVANNTNKPGKEDILDLVAASIVGDQTDEEMISWMRTPGESNGDPYYTMGGWNYYGDHLVNYKKAQVSSEGPPGNMSTAGGLAGQGVYLLGSIDPKTGQGPFFGPVMVDLDPTSGQTTQIFVGGLLVGTMEQPKLLIRYDTVSYSHSLALRIINGESDSPSSSKANGTFQLTIPFSKISKIPFDSDASVPNTDVPNSIVYDSRCPSINAIMSDPKAVGIVLRFSMFEMAPYMTTAELVADYQANTNSSNPSSGRVIGSIGPSYEGEPDTCPPGRLLANSVGGAVGYANVSDSFLSMDTVSLMFKDNFRSERKNYTGPIGANIQFDSIAISAGSTNIGSYDPLSQDYYLYGGIIDVPIDAANKAIVQSNPLQLVAKQGDNSVLINETPLRIYSNDRNIYIDDIADTPERSCIVSYLGGPLINDTIFTIASSSSGEIPNPDFLDFSQPIRAPAGSSSITYKVKDKLGSTAGFETLTIASEASNYFVNFRKYPTSNFGIAAGETITWQQVYQHALRFFYVVFPAMSKRIPLNFEGSIKGTGAQILARTSDQYRPTTLYMPIVRSMTPSQIKLLTAYLNGTPWDPDC